MGRTKLVHRKLPDYTVGEEIMNMVTHIVGASLGVAALVLCVVFSAIRGNVWGVVGCSIYGASIVALYTISSIYHGLHAGTAKKVMQILDHCTIYMLIAGTYTPILFCSIRPVSAAWSWVIFGIVWGCAAFASVFTAIDLKKYSKFSMACYIGMGWCIVLAAKTAIEAIPLAGLLWLLGGGIVYTVGAVLYGIGKKHRYVHSLFHIFVVIASVMQFVCVFWYVI